MDFTTYKKGETALKDWNANEGGYPDSRDPKFQPYLTGVGANPQDYEKAVVCLVAWREGRKNLYRGIMSVGHVCRNRSLISEMGNIYLEAMLLPSQDFEFPSEKDSEFAKMLHHVDELFAGALLDTTNGALSYTDSSKGEYATGVLERTAVTGTLTFYK